MSGFTDTQSVRVSMAELGRQLGIWSVAVIDEWAAETGCSKFLRLVALSAVYETSEMVAQYEINDPQAAVLFKLRWGGNI